MNHRDHKDHREKLRISFSLCPLRSLWLILFFFSACIPTPSAPNPDTTPGGAIITRNTYRNDLFSVTYPAGWRAITSPAGAPPSVTFVAPGDCALIVVSSTPIDSPPTAPSCDQPDIQVIEREASLDGQQIVIAGSAPGAGWDEFLAALDRVAASLRAGA